MMEYRVSGKIKQMQEKLIIRHGMNNNYTLRIMAEQYLKNTMHKKTNENYTHTKQLIKGIKRLMSQYTKLSCVPNPLTPKLMLYPHAELHGVSFYNDVNLHQNCPIFLATTG